MAKGRFVYGGRSAEEVTRRAKQSTGNYDSAVIDGYTMFKPKEGENVIRILPPTWLSYDANDRVIKDEVYEKWGSGWECQVSVHNNVGPDRGTFLCLAKMQDSPCPVCEARREAVDDDERFALSPNLRALAWVIDRNDQKAGPQWWMMPMKKIFKVICARSIDKKSGDVLLVDSPEEGYDISFMREGTGKTTDYTAVDLDREPSPLHENEKTAAKWLKYAQDNPLPEILNYQDADYIEKVLMGKVSKKKDADEEDETEGRLKPRRARRGDDEEEDEAPRRTARRRADLEEEEDEDEDTSRKPGRRAASDEDDDDAPSKRRRAKPEPEEEEEAPFDEDEKPKARAKKPAADEDDDEAAEAPKPKRGGAKKPTADEDDDEDPPPRARKAAPAEDDDDDPPAESRAARKGLERLKPKAKKKPVDDDED